MAVVEDVQILDGGRPAHAGVAREGRDVQQFAVSDEQRGYDAKEAAPTPDVEQRQDVPREEAVHPFLEPERIRRRRQQLVRKPSVQKPPLQIRRAGPTGGLAPEDRSEANRPFPPRQRVAESAARVERGGARGQHPNARPGVCRDLEQTGRVFGPVHFVQHDSGAGRKTSEKRLRIREAIPHRGQVAIEVANVRHLPAEDRLPEAPGPREPDDVAGVPRALDPVDPERTQDGRRHRYILQKTREIGILDCALAYGRFREAPRISPSSSASGIAANSRARRK